MKPEVSNTGADPQTVAPSPETAGEIMTADVVSVRVGTSIRDVALLLLEKRISAIPVLAVDRQLVGMVSEGDLLGRGEDDRRARRDWWLAMLRDGRFASTESLEVLGARPVEQVMRAPVITIEARAPLHEVAEMLRTYDIKRLPVMRGETMVGIVSRSDLVRAAATQIPQPSRRSAGGLLSMFDGLMQTDVRPEDFGAAIRSEPRTVARPAVTADAFRTLVSVSKQAERDDAIVAKRQAKQEQQRRIQKMLGEHLHPQVWTGLLGRARAAATQGEKSFELFRFPCEVCSDGSRKIDVAESDWPTTLRGEAAEIFTRWERELRPAGFGLTAQIVEYFDGMPGNVALTLTWNPREAAT